MFHLSSGLKILTTSAVVAVGGGLGIFLFGPVQDPGPWRTWKKLRLEAKSIPLFSGRVEMELRREGGKTVFETRTRAKFFGATIARSETRTTIDRATGVAERYVSLTRKRGRLYRFGEESYTVERLDPVNGPDAPLDRWKVTSSEEFAYPVGEDGRTVRVFDYYGMLLHLREANLHRTGDEVTLHVATSSGPTPYTVRVGEIRTAERRFEELASGSKKVLEIREMRLRISPADPERADEGFLRMEGETELWVEAESKTLLDLKGKAPKIPGQIKLTLAAMG